MSLETLYTVLSIVASAATVLGFVLRILWKVAEVGRTIGSLESSIDTRLARVERCVRRGQRNFLRLHRRVTVLEGKPTRHLAGAASEYPPSHHGPPPAAHAATDVSTESRSCA